MYLHATLLRFIQAFHTHSHLGELVFLIEASGCLVFTRVTQQPGLPSASLISVRSDPAQVPELAGSVPRLAPRVYHRHYLPVSPSPPASASRAGL